MEPRMSRITPGAQDLERSVRFCRADPGLPAARRAEPGVNFLQACGVSLVLLLAALPAAAGQDTVLPERIVVDTVWSGHVVIPHDVVIIGATVRVRPGTVIRFEGVDEEAPPRLRLDAPPIGTAWPGPACTRLILDGTEDEPVIIESAEDGPRGAILAGPASCGSIIARHTIFRRLGQPIETGRMVPAIHLRLSDADDDLWLTDCRFEACGPVWIRFFGSHAGADIRRCHFEQTAGAIALLLDGPGEGAKLVRDNIADAAIRATCPQLLIENNVLIGDNAHIAVASDTAAAIRIDGNYVHCTTREAVGRFALRVESPDAVVRNNVLRGGTYVVESAPRRVVGNVLIGAAELEARLLSPHPREDRAATDEDPDDVPDVPAPAPFTTSSHYLIRHLPAEAVVTDNLFLGPAHAALATSEPAGRPRLLDHPADDPSAQDVSDRTRGPRITHNLFDGWWQAGRAVHLDRMPQAFTHNVITRYRRAPVFNETPREDDAAEIGHNLFAGIDPPWYEQLHGIPDRAPGDRHVDTFADLRLSAAPSTREAVDLESKLLDREITVADVRAAWFDACMPLPASPLLTDDPPGPRGHDATTPATPATP